MDTISSDSVSSDTMSSKSIRSVSYLIPILLAVALAGCDSSKTDGGDSGAGRIVSTPSGATGYFSATFGSAPSDFGYGYSGYTGIMNLGTQQVIGEQFGWGPWLIPDNRNFSSPLCPVGTVARDNWPERGPTYSDVYQTIEGGTGRWTSTTFPTSVPKFRLNTTPDCYNTEIASTGWSFYQSRLPSNKLGVAQLTNRFIFPPDGLPFVEPMQPELLGYAWMALPFIPAMTSSLDVPTGDQSWTLLLKATNFAGLVAFYTPETYSNVHASDLTGATRGLDARPALMGSEALELGNLPMKTSTDNSGVRFRRIPPVRFDADENGKTMLLQEMKYYSKGALWNGIQTWMQDGIQPNAFQDGESYPPLLSYCCGWIRFQGEDGSKTSFDEFLKPGVYPTGGGTRGLGMTGTIRTEDGQIALPEYFKEEKPNVWVGIREEEVPGETGLKKATFAKMSRTPAGSLNLSQAGPWTPGGWAAGPFSVALSDGSFVQYVWYRFVDQPAIKRLSLPDADIDRLQLFVEALHRTGGGSSLVFSGPNSGELATLDPSLFVVPPAGLEVGYVPIVISQQ
ncbi:hypothetical protein HQ496_01680 [bacterium]|nr:hypothetical protein [bacterium]